MRIARHRAIAAALEALSEDQIVDLLGDGTASIGGSTSTIEVAGSRVFAKRIALTELERRHPRSTANLFQLPATYQYGIGSSGFNVWRELASHERTTAWVIDGTCDAFPLLHHTRELDAPPAMAMPVEQLTAGWGNAPAIRARLEAIAAAPASLVLFLEHVPHTVSGWFTGTEKQCALLERETARVVEVLRAHDVLHMDAHWGNWLTDGNQIYLSDFGLATSRGFELSEEERAFFDAHVDYDEQLTRRELVHWVWKRFGDALPGFARGIVNRHRETAEAIEAMWRAVRPGAVSVV